MNKEKDIFMFDVESDGLYGEAIAIGAVVYDTKGFIKDSFICRKSLDDVTNDFVIENVIPNIKNIDNIVETGLELRNNFWDFYMKHKGHCKIWSDVNYPVETNLFSQCIKDNIIEREFEGPYPLLDVATVFKCLELDPDTDRIKFAKQHGCNVSQISELVHNPIVDSQISVACLLVLKDMLDKPNKTDKIVAKSVDDYISNYNVLLENINLQPKVFLGGTCNNSTWRDEIIKKLKINYFNPVVEDWNEECMKEEERQKDICKYHLYVITPKMKGTFSIAEAVESSNKIHERTLFCVLNNDGTDRFDKSEIRSLEQVAKIVQNNGGLYFKSLDKVCNYLNSL